MRLGITGTRDGMTLSQEDMFLDVLELFDDVKEFHHGDCIGVDAEAATLVTQYFPNCTTISHPPIKDKFRAFHKSKYVRNPKDYLDRNKDIVECCDVLIAIPAESTEQLRSGTWSTVRYARKLGKPVMIIRGPV